MAGFGTFRTRRIAATVVVVAAQWVAAGSGSRLVGVARPAVCVVIPFAVAPIG